MPASWGSQHCRPTLLRPHDTSAPSGQPQFGPAVGNRGGSAVHPDRGAPPQPATRRVMLGAVEASRQAAWNPTRRPWRDCFDDLVLNSGSSAFGTRVATGKGSRSSAFGRLAWVDAPASDDPFAALRDTIVTPHRVERGGSGRNGAG